MHIKIESVAARAVSVPYVIIRHIARGTETHAEVIQVSLTAHGKTGRGESHPTMRYNETNETIFAAVERPSMFTATRWRSLIDWKSAWFAR